MYVCICSVITDGQIREAVERGAATVKQLNRALGVAGKCGKCAVFAQQVLTATLAESVADKSCDATALARGA